MQDPADNARKAINVSSDSTLGRVEASNLAVYSDGIAPVSSVVAVPAANASGWNNGRVALTLSASDLRNGMTSELPGWVDRIHYSLSGAHAVSEQLISGQPASIDVTAPGVTNLDYWATDAAGNDEAARSLTIRIDPTAPVVEGMPASCALSSASNSMVQVVQISAFDALSGVVPGSFRVTATSSDPSDPNSPDVSISQSGANSFTVSVRAAKLNPGPARVYTISASAQDLAGNSRTVSANCVVTDP